jgi:t-SNARE complex subunit (syntaxin)
MEVVMQEIVDLLQDQAQVQLVQQTLVAVVAVVVMMARHKVELVDLV